MEEGDDTYAELYRAAIPSVVSIYLTGGDRGHGAGSGFVYEVETDESGETGYVVTNEHVVRAAGGAQAGRPADVSDLAVDVRFSEGDWRVGRVVGSDPYTDLAVLAVGDLPEYARPLPVADRNPEPGEPVAALGNPMGLDGSIARGIVSGASRSMPTGNGFAIPDAVQTDAPINPGNSGGPLVTLDGEVVGVNRARGGDNIGFAVSAAVLSRVVPVLVEAGEYRHSYLKVQTLDVSPTVAEANGLDEPGGVLVVDVRLGPASGALVGCRETRTVRGREVPTGGDVIVAVDGDRVDSHEELVRHLLLETRPGETVEVELVRDGEALTEEVTLAERPQPSPDRGGGRHVPVR